MQRVVATQRVLSMQPTPTPKCGDPELHVDLVPMDRFVMKLYPFRTFIIYTIHIISHYLTFIVITITRSQIRRKTEPIATKNLIASHTSCNNYICILIQALQYGNPPRIGVLYRL